MYSSNFTNNDGGPQIAQTGDGRQYNNNDRGPQFNHSSFYGTTNINVKVLHLVEAIKCQEEKEACLRSLSYQNIDARRIDISSAHPETCDWFFDTEPFEKWRNRTDLSNHNGVLWVKGNPGTGKSTLMKHTLKRCKEKLFKDHLVAAHFFNARGDSFEHTPLGLLRSLVYQLVEQEPSIYEHFIALFRDRRLKHANWQWGEAELREFILSETQSCSKPILLLVDALDECSESHVRDVVKFLETLSIETKTELNVCLSSRHYPSVRMQRCLEIVLEATSEHDQDIIAYVHDKLSVENKEIESELLRHASGVFMWVVLVVELLNKACDEGQTEAMQKTLNEIPKNLDELFQALLMKDNPVKQETIFMFQFVLVARRLLSPEELFFATMTYIQVEDAEIWDSAKLSQDDIRRRIVHSSRGLIEIRKGETETVQFIHKSVNDFLIRNKRLLLLDPLLSSNLVGQSHARLRACCMSYITRKAFQPAGDRAQIKALRANNPFLKYASLYIFEHAEEAESNNIDQSRFLQQLKDEPAVFERLRLFHNTFEKHSGTGCFRGASLLYMLAFHGYSRLTKTLLEMGADVNSGGGLLGTALQAAAAEGQQGVVVMLLKWGADVNAQGGIFGTALQAAAKANEKDIIELLFRAGADVNASNGVYGTALHYAAYGNFEEIVSMLLQWGANVNMQGGCLGTALQAAVFEGNDNITELLLEAGAAVDLQGGFFYTALQAAAAAGRKWSVQTLLKKGADVNIRGGLYGTALQAAALQAAAIMEQEAIVELLLQEGADVHLQGGAFGSALQAATFSGSTRITEMLLRKGAVRNNEPELFSATLQEAIAEGGAEIIAVLMEEGVSDHTRMLCHAAFIASSTSDFTKMLENLLKEEVHAGSQFILDCALMDAVTCGREGTVASLLEKGAKPTAHDEYMISPLEAAVFKGKEKIITLLLEKEADINAQNNGAVAEAQTGIKASINRVDTKAGVQISQILIYSCVASLIAASLIRRYCSGW